MCGGLLAYYLMGVSAVLSVNVLLFFTAFYHRPSIRCNPLLSYSVIIGAGYLFVFQYLKYQSLGFYVDFSHWGEVICSIADTCLPFSRSVQFLHPDRLNYFSVHFTPLIYLFAVPFRFFPYSETILFLNFCLMMSAAIPLYKLAAIHHEDRRFRLFMIILLFWFPTFQYIVLYECEMLRFSIPLLLWMLYFWVIRKRSLFFLFAFLAMLVREEVGLTVMMFGLYAVIFEKRKVDGLLTALLGFVGFLVITQVVMPSLNTVGGHQHIAATLFSAFGDSPVGIVKGIVRHPGLVLRTVLNPIKLANIFMLFLPLAFVPLLAPSVLACMMANLGVGLLSSSITHTSYMLYYVSPSVPFIFYAFIKGWPRLIAAISAIDKKLARGTIRDYDGTAMAWICGVMLVANVFFGPSPISLQFWFKNLRPAPFRTHNYHYSAYRVTDHHRKVESFCSLIPDSAVVSAEQFLAPRLYRKRGIMVFPQLESVDGKTEADYVFIDKTNPMKTGIGAVPGSWDGLRKDPQAYYDLVEKNPQRWELIRSDDGYYLYRRRSPQQREP